MDELANIPPSREIRVGDRSHTDTNASISGGPQLSDRETALVAQMRAESNSYKDSFTWQAFQALSISSVALSGILYLMFHGGGPPHVGLTALAILGLALVTCRMGGYSYSSANRHYGYELFLYRIRTIPAGRYGRWKGEYADIEWEAAMRAWRVVQASLYEAIYVTPSEKTFLAFLKPDRYRPGFDPKRKSLWFSQSSLFGDEKGVTWYAGSYLARVQSMLFLVALAAVIILVITAIAVFFRPPIHASHFPFPALRPLIDPALKVICAIAAVLAWKVRRARIKVEGVKRQMLEDGLLSIHSCAIVWQAVIVAHFTALERARKWKLSSWELADLSKAARRKWPREWKQWQDGDVRFETIIGLAGDAFRAQISEDGAGLAGYTFWLGQEAASLARCAHDVPGWVGVGEVALHNLKNVDGAPPQKLAFFRRRHT